MYQIAGTRVIAVVPRYLVVGGACALLNVAILIVGDALHVPLTVSIAVSFVIVCMVGYRLHARITFDVTADRQGFLRYVLVMAANLPVSTLLLWLFARALAWPMSIAAPCVTVTMVLVNFLTSRWAVTRSFVPSDTRH